MFSLPSHIIRIYLLLAALRQVSSSPQPSRPSPSVTSTIFATPTSNSPIPTSSASPLCYAQNQDPGLGYLSQFCICGTLNFPLSTPTPSPILWRADDYCAYTTLVSTPILKYTGIHLTISKSSPVWTALRWALRVPWVHAQPFRIVIPK